MGFEGELKGRNPHGSFMELYTWLIKAESGRRAGAHTRERGHCEAHAAARNRRYVQAAAVCAPRERLKNKPQPRMLVMEGPIHAVLGAPPLSTEY